MNPARCACTLVVLFFASWLAVAQAEKPASPRLPVPEGMAVEEAEKLVRGTFKADYAKKKPTEQLATAVKLLKAADEMNDNPPAKFVLYREAADFASRGGDLVVALEAVAGMSQSFAIKPLDMQLGLLESAETARVVPGRSVMEAALEIAQDAVRGDDYELALKILKVASRAATRAGSTASINAVTSHTREVELIQKTFKALEQDRNALATNANDPAANLKVGRFLCLLKGDWELGLPLLAKGSDLKLKAAAEREQPSPGAAADRIALADRWLELSAALEGPEKIECRVRAYQWYQETLPALNALAKPRAEKLIADMEKTGDVRANRAVGWNVLFRSSDPTVWNTDTNRGRYHFAQPLSKSPIGTRFLRLSEMGKGNFIVIEMARDRLGEYSERDGYAWMGKNIIERKANHLGISDVAWGDQQKGSILVYNVSGVVGYRGWGFGHRVGIDDGQGFAWVGEPTPKTVFEFAVKVGPLTVEESKRLLKKKK